MPPRPEQRPEAPSDDKHHHQQHQRHAGTALCPTAHQPRIMNDDSGDDGGDQGPVMLGSIAAALASATAFTAARVYCSAIIMNRTRREDLVIVLSLLLLWAGSIFTILAVQSGMGKHAAALTVDQRAAAKFYYILSVWPALLAITVPKAAVAGLIIRIFTPDVWARVVMSAMVCLGIVNYVVISALSTFQCQPLEAVWDARVPAVKCVSAKVYLDLCYFTSSFSASVDFYLAVSPAIMFRKIGFSIIKRTGLSIVLGLGVVVTVVACLKISYLDVLANEADFTWTAPRLIIWTIIEGTVTIVAACVPVLHPLYDLARAGLSKLVPGLGQKNPRYIAGHGMPGGRSGAGAGESPAGFWTIKLRAIGLAEWPQSTTTGVWSTALRRSGARAGGQTDGGPSALVTAAAGSGEGGGPAAVHSEGTGAERQRGLERPGCLTTVGADGLVDVLNIERGQGRVADIEEAPNPTRSAKTTAP